MRSADASNAMTNQPVMRRGSDDSIDSSNAADLADSLCWTELSIALAGFVSKVMVVVVSD